MDNKQSENYNIMSSEICLRASLEEYQHTIQRASKFENKMYILITFCSLYSAFILSIFQDFSILKFPETMNTLIFSIVYILLFIAMVILYIVVLVSLVISLKSIVIKRYDPMHLIAESLYNKPQLVVNMLLTKKYIECTNDNNATLTKLYSKNEIINTLLVWLVIVSFVLKLISYFL